MTHLQIARITKLVAVFSIFAATSVAFQNCSDVQFLSGVNSNTSSPSSLSNNAAGSLNDIGNNVPTATADGSVYQPSGFQQTNCSLTYPYESATPATNVSFSESDVLAAFSISNDASTGKRLRVNVWYSDEHAMTLGIRRIIRKTTAGTTTADYPVAALTASPGAQADPQVGATAQNGNQAGTDSSSCSSAPGLCGRPIWPALFITDTTANSADVSGDWQFGGAPVTPSAVYGTWKAAVKTIDETTSPVSIVVTPDADPAKNNWNLGVGIAAPPGVNSEGFSSVVSWDLTTAGLISGHSYRLQFMVHDGDQNKSGGDVGENCLNIKVP